MFITTDFLNFKTIAGVRRGPEEGLLAGGKREGMMVVTDTASHYYRLSCTRQQVFSCASAAVGGAGS